jgi:type VI secretion system protein ImpL
LRLAPVHSLAQGAQLARTLAAEASPLTALLRAAVRDTAGGATQSWFAPLRAHLGGGIDAPANAPMSRTQALLARLAAQLDQAAAATQRGTLPPAAEALRELAQEARQAPAPLGRLLGQLHAAVAGLLQAAVREPLSREIARDIAPACTRAIAQRYPFARDAAADVSRDDFARVFGAGGLLDGFAQRHFAALGDEPRGDAAAPWRRAQAIREAYFRDGGRALGTRLEWRLLELDAAAAEFTLDVDGQVLRFKRDARQPQTLEWLTLGGAGRVHVQLAPGSGSGYTFNGPWALLRLLDRARVERSGAPDRVHVTFDIEGRKVRFEVRSAAAPHPLLRTDLETFACPSRW